MLHDLIIRCSKEFLALLNWSQIPFIMSSQITALAYFTELPFNQCTFLELAENLLATIPPQLVEARVISDYSMVHCRTLVCCPCLFYARLRY